MIGCAAIEDEAVANWTRGLALHAQKAVGSHVNEVVRLTLAKRNESIEAATDERVEDCGLRGIPHRLRLYADNLLRGLDGIDRSPPVNRAG
jgi:hypothetical protein